MNKFFIMSLMLVGCSQVVSQQDIAAANEFCKDKEGLFSIQITDSDLMMTATCKNGDRAHENDY